MAFPWLHLNHITIYDHQYEYYLNKCFTTNYYYYIIIILLLYLIIFLPTGVNPWMQGYLLTSFAKSGPDSFNNVINQWYLLGWVRLPMSEVLSFFFLLYYKFIFLRWYKINTYLYIVIDLTELFQLTTRISIYNL